MSTLNLIIDRTIEDVYEVALLNDLKWANMSPDERTAYLEGMRGAYTITDFNRVDIAVNLLVDLLRDIGISVTVNTRTWEMQDVDDPDILEIYLNNIRTLREAFRVLPTTPDVPSDMDNLNYETANDIERILFDLSKLIIGVINNVNLGWAMGIAHIGLHSSI